MRIDRKKREVKLISVILGILVCILSFFGIFRSFILVKSRNWGWLFYLFLSIILFFLPLVFVIRREASLELKIDLYKEWKFFKIFLILLLVNFLVQQSIGFGGEFMFLYYPMIIMLALRTSLNKLIFVYILFLILEMGSSYYTTGLISDIKRIAGHGLGVLFVGGIVFYEKEKWQRQINRLKNLEARLIPLLSTSHEVNRDEISKVSLLDAREGLKFAHLSLNEELERVITLIHRVFGCQTSAVFLLDSNREVLIMRGFRSYSKVIKNNASVRVGQGLIGWVAKEGKEFLTEDFSQDSLTLGYYEKPEVVRSILAVPIYAFGQRLEGLGVIGGKLVGVLIVDDQEPRAFDANRKQILREFSEDIGRVLHYHNEKILRGISANQYKALNILLEELTAKLRIDEVLDSLVGKLKVKEKEPYIVQSDHLVILLKETEGNRWKVTRKIGKDNFPAIGEELNLERTLVGQVIERKISHYDPDLYRGEEPSPRFSVSEKRNHGFHSFLCIPLIAENECLGVMVLEGLAKDFYKEHDIEVVSILAKQAGMALRSAQLFEEKEKLALRDGLTGLANHRHFQEILVQEIENTKKKERVSLSILMVDIDHFKSLNDTFGHQKGDEVLQEVAKLLLEEVRSCDLVGRYGGEEFVIILVDTDLEKGREIAERIRTRVENHKFGVDRKVTISIGLATYPKNAKDKGSLIREADLALYLAKRERNKVCAPGEGELVLFPPSKV